MFSPLHVAFCLFVQVTINGVDIGSFDSNPGSTFTAVGMDADNVSTLSFTPIGIDDDEWISLIEVSVAHSSNSKD